MRSVSIWAVCLLVLWGCATLGAAGRYIEVEVEVFRPWNFLHWGAWEGLEPRLVSTRVAPPTEDEAAVLSGLRSQCQGLDSAECSLLEGVKYRFHRAYILAPELGRNYRIVLRNLSEAHLGVVLSVDGLNSNGSEHIAGDVSDRKWILLPRQTVRIAGWQVTEDEALQFRFVVPSQAHALLGEARGEIAVYVYLPNPFDGEFERGTGAGGIIDQPTVRVPFKSATNDPIETLTFNYSRDRVTLGILCEETDGAGVRVLNVVEGTIAEIKGLKAGDVITYANAVPVRSCGDLQEILATKSPGDRVVLKVHRADRAFLLTLELEE